MKANNQNTKQTLADLVSCSLILPFFYRIALFLYKSVRESAIGRFFCSYDKDNEAMGEGYLSIFLRKLDINDRILRPVRFAIAGQFDNSMVLNAIRRCLDRLAGMSLGTYGLGCLMFSLFSSIAYVLKYLAARAEHMGLEPAVGDIVIAALMLFIGICLVATGSHLSEALCQSRLTSFLLFRAAGVNEAYFRECKPTHGKSFISALIGALLGICTLAMSPLYIVIGVLVLLAAFLVYKIPEFGVVAVLFLMPFLPTMVLVALMMYLIACFFVKYLRGKRILHFGWIDLCILLFMAVLLFAGLISASGTTSLFAVMVFLCFMCGYFLVVNLVRSSVWLDRCFISVLSSATIVALYGIYQNFFVTADTTWQDTEMFSEISGRVVSTLENPNVLAEYLIMILPIAAAGFLTAKMPSRKLLYLFSGGILGACLIFTWSRGAWLGLLIAMMLFLLIYSKKVLVIGLFGVLAIPFLPFILPDSIINRFTSIGNLGDSSTSYRVHIWQGTINMVKDYFASGIGVGVDAFQKIYPKYSLSGIETAPHSHNLYLQILVETGIFGLLLFLIFLLTFVKHNFSFYVKPLPQKRRVFTAALFCGILAVLAQGMTDYIWYNYRVFLMFWLLIGLSVAAARTTESENRDQLLHAQQSCADAAVLDLHLAESTFHRTERKSK